MKQCPLSGKSCSTACAWFKESRRKYKDHIEGECSLVAIGRISDRLIEVSHSINGVERIIRNTDFMQ